MPEVLNEFQAFFIPSILVHEHFRTYIVQKHYAIRLL